MPHALCDAVCDPWEPQDEVGHRVHVQEEHFPDLTVDFGLGLGLGFGFVSWVGGWEGGDGGGDGGLVEGEDGDGRLFVFREGFFEIEIEIDEGVG